MTSSRRASAPAGRVQLTEEGPVIVDGPVEIVMDDGTVARSDRHRVALCTCRRSKIAPFCDTSHRSKLRAERDPS